MPLINTSVPNLIQGVSQQPNSARFSGQCEEQENALSSVAEGLKKRPNTRHVARLLQSAISSNAKVHFINRTDDERYVLIHDGTLRIFNIDTGVEATITDVTDAGLVMSSEWSDLISPSGTAANSFEIFEQTSDASFDVDTIKAINNSGYGVMHIDILDDLVADNEVTISFYVDEIVGSDWTVDIRRVNINSTNYINDTDEAPQSITTTGFKTITFNITGNTGSGTAGVFFYTNTVGNSITIRGLKVVKDNSPSNYLTDGVTNPRKELEFLTVADYTFCVNKQKIVEENATYTPDYSSSAVVFIKQISYKTGYAVGTNLGNIGVTTGTSDASQNGNANWNNQLATFHGDDALNVSFLIEGSPTSNGYFNTTGGFVYQLNLISGIFASSIGGKSILVEGHTAIEVSDSLSNEGIGLVWKTVDSISNLPLFAKNGLIVKIAGDVELNQDDYYVKFVTNSGGVTGRGYWEETVSPNTSLGIDTSTAPHQLVNIGLNQFLLQRVAFSNRNAGDSETNPHPSFVGKKINSVFFFKNRLGFVTDDGVVMSEAGEFFNFYRKTVTTLLDSAPIDIEVASSKVTNLTSALGFQGDLMLFSNNQQFVLRGGDILTPKTVSINSTTSFDTESDVTPLALGSYIYFPFTRGLFTGVRELTVNATTETYDGVEITEHVPYYIPKNIISISGTSSENIIAILSSDEPDALYIYNYFWNNNQKVLSAWSKFTFTGEIRGIEFIESTLYAVITNADETHLVELPLESGLIDDAGFTTHLDMRTSVTIPAGASSFTIPYKAEAEDDLQVYTKTGSLLLADHNQNSVQLKSPVEEDTDVWVGLAYNMKYVFSEQVFKQQAENTKTPTNSAKIVIRNGSLFFDETGAFTVKINSKHRDPIEVPFSSSKVGTTILNTADLDSGAFRFSVGARPEEAVISVENDTALPCKFQSAEFESFAQIRSTRYS